jgi:transcriptional regulator with XRE-family HTH domain
MPRSKKQEPNSEALGTESGDASIDLNVLVGTNIRRLRTEAGITAEELAIRLRLFGLAWTRSTITALETGRKTIDIAEFVALVMAFGGSVEELFGGAGYGLLPDGDPRPLQELRELFGGGSNRSSLNVLDASIGFVADASWGPDSASRNEAEQKAARKFGVDVATVTSFSSVIWGRSLTEEREARVTERVDGTVPRRTLQAIRGQVTRELLTELEPHVTKGS